MSRIGALWSSSHSSTPDPRKGNSNSLFVNTMSCNNLTGEPALCFHTGMIQAFIWDFGTPKQRLTSRQETAALLDEIGREFGVGRNDQLKYRHNWRAGDVILSDNLAVAHEASPETQLPPSQVIAFVLVVMCLP